MELICILIQAIEFQQKMQTKQSFMAIMVSLKSEHWIFNGINMITALLSMW